VKKGDWLRPSCETKAIPLAGRCLSPFFTCSGQAASFAPSRARKDFSTFFHFRDTIFPRRANRYVTAERHGPVFPEEAAHVFRYVRGARHLSRRRVQAQGDRQSMRWSVCVSGQCNPFNIRSEAWRNHWLHVPQKRHAEWSPWSDRAIARRCEVSQVFISKLRRDASQNGFEIEPRQSETRRHGYLPDGPCRRGPILATGRAATCACFR
jgi:hypothetical protein